MNRSGQEIIKRNRQSLRKILLLLSFSVFPKSVIYMAPAPPLMSLRAGVLNLSVITISTIVVSGFIFRRSFCGWICPGGGCQLVSSTLNNEKFKHEKNNWIHIIMVGIWISAMIGMVFISDQLPQLNLSHPGAGKFATSDIRFYLPYIPVVIFIFLFVFLFGKRGFCHRGCWIAPMIAATTRLGKILHIPSLYVAVMRQHKCNNCKQCTKKCPMSIDVHKHVLSKTKLPNNCIQCGVCIDSCTQDIFSFSYGLEK